MAKVAKVHKPGSEIRNFTDRADQQQVFRNYLAAGGDQTLPFLCFYGVGGVGKSWLGKRLREVAGDAENSDAHVPCSFVDFDPASSQAGGTYHNDAAMALAAVRRGFAVPCHRFDLAFAVLQFKGGVAPVPAHREARAGKTLNDALLEGGAALLSDLPGGKFLAWAAKQGYNWAAPQLQKTPAYRWLEEQLHRERAALLTKEPQEIRAELAERLGADLDENLPPRPGKKCRGVVFYDTYESLWYAGVSDALNRQRDDWVRLLYQCTDHVLYVALGRDRLDWDKEGSDPQWWANSFHLEQHHLGSLSDGDARTFLHRCEIHNSELLRRILQLCVHEETGQTVSGEPAVGYYPLKLGLCADTCAVLRSRRQEPNPADFDLPTGDIGAIADRLLRALPDGQAHWLARLALPPRFDETAALAAYAPVRTADAEAAWDLLTDLSFMNPPARDEWWTLHGQMRDTLRRRAAFDPPKEAETQAWWQQHWQSRSHETSDDFAGLAWYHAYCLEAKPARLAWYDLAQTARTALDMTAHLRMIQWWNPTGLETRAEQTAETGAALNDLGIQLWQATLGDRDANLKRSISCYKAALRVRTEADFPLDWARTQSNLGAAYNDLPSGDREANLRQAIACYEAALRVRTETDFPSEWAVTQNNLGAAYSNLPASDRAQNLRQAIACYEAALRVYTESAFPFEWARTQNNLGIAYSDLPSTNRDANLKRAIGCYEAALRVRTEDSFRFEWARTQNNLGVAYKDLPSGDRTGNLRRSITCYEATLRVYMKETFPLDWTISRYNMAVVYRELGDFDAAYEALNDAVHGFEAVGHLHFTEMAENTRREWEPKFP